MNAISLISGGRLSQITLYNLVGTKLALDKVDNKVELSFSNRDLSLNQTENKLELDETNKKISLNKTGIKLNLGMEE